MGRGQSLVRACKRSLLPPFVFPSKIALAASDRPLPSRAEGHRGGAGSGLGKRELPWPIGGKRHLEGTEHEIRWVLASNHNLSVDQTSRMLPRRITTPYDGGAPAARHQTFTTCGRYLSVADIKPQR